MNARAAPMLEPVAERGWQRGLPNLLRSGLRAWWSTSTWWIQVLIWVGVTALPLAGVLFSEGGTDDLPAVSLFSIMAMFTSVAVAIIMQDEIVGERKSGTAEWVLSKPVARPAFVVAKLLANGVGMLVTMVLAPGLVAYALVAIVQEPPDPIGFVAGLGIIGLNVVFYLTLTLMLGTMLSSAGAVIGIALAFAFGQQFLTQFPVVAELLPWALLVPLNQESVSDASALMLGQPMPNPLAVPVAAIASVAFVVLAVRQFSRAEF